MVTTPACAHSHQTTGWTVQYDDGRHTAHDSHPTEPTNTDNHQSVFAFSDDFMLAAGSSATIHWGLHVRDYGDSNRLHWLRPQDLAAFETADGKRKFGAVLVFPFTPPPKRPTEVVTLSRLLVCVCRVCFGIGSRAPGVL